MRPSNRGDSRVTDDAKPVLTRQHANATTEILFPDKAPATIFLFIMLIYCSESEFESSTDASAGSIDHRINSGCGSSDAKSSGQSRPRFGLNQRNVRAVDQPVQGHIFAEVVR